MNVFIEIVTASWDLLKDSSVYIFFGIFVSGVLRAFLSPSIVMRHLGTNRFSSVFKAVLLGIPIPLCSCGVVPAAASLKRQGANNGATTAFLISTPETGIDSISISYALLDPILTVARPCAAFVTATAAGLAENTLFPPKGQETVLKPDLSCPVDGCCDGLNCEPEVHKRHHTFGEKFASGMHYAFRVLWPDLAPWFVVGILLAGIIDALVPTEILAGYLGGGIGAMLIMLVVGVPLYICATASTPIAASLILKGVSPGAALVFLLAAPATNAASLPMLMKVLGKRGTTVYLVSIAVMSVLLGLALDWVYALAGLSAQATLGQAAEIIPRWAQISGAAAVLVLSAGPTARFARGHIKSLLGRRPAPSCGCGVPGDDSSHGEAGHCHDEKEGCGCSVDSRKSIP